MLFFLHLTMSNAIYFNLNGYNGTIITCQQKLGDFNITIIYSTARFKYACQFAEYECVRLNLELLKYEINSQL
jgi:hypothetical protein